MKRIVLILLFALQLPAQRFLADDPLDREPRPRPVGQAQNRKLSDYYDLFSNQFHKVGEKQPKKGPPIRSMAVNTLGEPMDGAWYQKRHYYRRMTLDELTRGPGQSTPPSTAGKWTVVSAKSEGVTPGFVIIDPDKRRYFIKFDPLSNPEMATSADSISARFFYALGYHVPENYLVYFKPEQLELGDNLEFADRTGKKRKMTSRDIYEILKKVPLSNNGTYRATASLAIPGKPIGPPRYYGTRSDDPNDIVPHEHRRDMRGLHVFCAWLGHDDSRAINNLDSLVKNEDGVQFVKHFLLDFGATLGSASSAANSARDGDYYFSWKSSGTQLFTLGLKPPYWAFAHFPHYPSIGRFESKVFDPEKWVPEYPNVAFLNRLPDDELWAAKQVMAFRDDEIKALVGTGQLSDPQAADYLVECLRERRTKIGRIYFAKVLPFDRFRIDGGRLAWDDLAKMHDLGGVEDVKVQWSRFDNNTGAKAAISGRGNSAVPEEGDYLAADLTSPSRAKQTVTIYVRRKAGTASIVGLDRTW
jgi:hypothetical protein